MFFLNSTVNGCGSVTKLSYLSASREVSFSQAPYSPLYFVMSTILMLSSISTPDRLEWLDADGRLVLVFDLCGLDATICAATVVLAPRLVFAFRESC